MLRVMIYTMLLILLFIGCVAAIPCRPTDAIWYWHTNIKPVVNINLLVDVGATVVHDYNCMPNIACHIYARGGPNPLDSTESLPMSITRAEGKKCIIGPQNGAGYRDSPVSYYNRKEACPRTACPITNGIFADGCDEFPFASTYEGGLGTTNGGFAGPTSYMCIPRSENMMQGQIMGMFYNCCGAGEDNFRFQIKAVNIPLGGCQAILTRPAPQGNGVIEILKATEPNIVPIVLGSQDWDYCVRMNSAGLAT